MYKILIILACLMLLLPFIGFFSYDGTYTVHAGNVVYEMGEEPAPSESCNGLTVILGDPKAHHVDGSVTGHCFGSVEASPAFTLEEASAIDGKRFFFQRF